MRDQLFIMLFTFYTAMLQGHPSIHPLIHCFSKLITLSGHLREFMLVILQIHKMDFYGRLFFDKFSD